MKRKIDVKKEKLKLYDELKIFTIEELQMMISSDCFNDKERFLLSVILDEKMGKKSKIII